MTKSAKIVYTFSEKKTNWKYPTRSRSSCVTPKDIDKNLIFKIWNVSFIDENRNVGEYLTKLSLKTNRNKISIYLNLIDANHVIEEKTNKKV